MLLRSSILAGVAAIALAGLAQAADPQAPSDMSTQSATPPTSTSTEMQAPAAGVALDQVQNPKTTLKGATVKDSKGDAIGEVKSVRLDTGGKVAAVDVKMGSKTVALNANTLSYMQAENTLISTQSKAEIQGH
ncbi:MAG: hypothetical protein GC190_14040 [Alphaproteobacteria bacterium]|nr:hypothetical protein [Alphaproteobacteria bacterium]